MSIFKIETYFADEMIDKQTETGVRCGYKLKADNKSYGAVFFGIAALIVSQPPFCKNNLDK